MNTIKSWFFSIALALTLVGLTSCANVTPAVYQGQTPVLKLEDYFNGTLDAWGMFQDRSGKVIKRFTVVMRCSWQGDTGTLDEDFTYSDGTKEKRVWTIKKGANGSYTGKAADVVGEAVGSAVGNALNWQYTLALKVDDKIYDVQLNDWLYLIDNRVLLNKASMSKFGFHLGDITLSFTKRN
jgi:Protein of unknown function (DUF3833)